MAKDALFVLPSPLAGEAFQVAEASVGCVYDIPVARRLAVGLGLVGTRDFVPSSLEFAYGRDPAGYMPFLRLKIR